MALDEKQVSYIAHLARLGIDDQALPDYVRELSNILDYVAQMDAIDTDAIEPMAHPLDLTQRLRPDLVKEGDQRELFQSIAPQVEQGLYLVPKVIEEG